MAGEYEAGRNFLRANWHLVEGGWESDQKKGVPAPPQETAGAADAPRVALPPPAGLEARGGALIELLRSRKSRRAFSADGLGLEELSFLCWAAEGVREGRRAFSFRTAPSGGARHPLDFFVYAARVDGVPEGLYYYEGGTHSLRLERAGDGRAGLDEALLGQLWGAAAVFAWAAVPYRTEWRYGPVAHKLVALDAGHACQNLYLACESLGLGTCAIGAYDQVKLDAFLGLDGEERFSLYAAPVGRGR